MKATQCSIGNCDKPRFGRGWCAMHYQRWRRYDSLELPPRPKPEPRSPRPRRRAAGTCAIEGCDKRIEKRGWCSMHLSRWKRHGTTDAPPRRPGVAPGVRRPRQNPSDLYQRVKLTDGGCWIWQGKQDRDGYGRLTRDTQGWFAHRWFYADAKGPIPAGMDVDHLCFVRLCVNPDHLEAVTRSENSLRMWAVRRTK